MEIPSKNNSKNQDNRKMSLRIGGGGGNIGGFILLGGALAAATFLGSAFAINSRKRRSNDHQPENPLPAPESDDDNHSRNGLTLVLPDSSNNETADTESGSTHNLDLEEKINLESNGIKLANGFSIELESSQLFDESDISTEENLVLSKESTVFSEDVKENKSSDEIEEILESGEAIVAEDSSQISVEDVPQKLQTVEKGCEILSEIVEEQYEEVIEGTESHTNENQEVEEECKSDCNTIVKSDVEGLEAARVEVVTQVTEDVMISIEASEVTPTQELTEDEIICSIEVSEVTATQELTENEENICSIEKSEVKLTQELTEDEAIICSTEESEVNLTQELSELEENVCSIEESEVKPAQEIALPTTNFVAENVNKEEEEFQHLQIKEEQELARTDDHESEQKDCLVEAFDQSPEAFESECGNVKVEDRDLVLTEDSLVVESDENIADKCVVAETSNSDECYDEKIQVSEEQEKSVVENIDSEEESAETNAVEDKPLVQSDEVEVSEGDGDKSIAVSSNEQLQFSELEDESSDDDEDTSEKAEESSEGSRDSSMESNADAVWPVRKSTTHEEPIKYLLDDSKIKNNNEYKFSEKKNYLSKVNSPQVKVWILLSSAALLLLLLLAHIFEPSFYNAPL